MNTLAEMIPVEAQEELLSRGFSMMRRPLKIEDDHSFMNGGDEMYTLTTRSFMNGLTATEEEGRVKLAVAGDKIKMSIDERGRVRPSVKGIALSGVKKLAVVKLVLRYSVVIDTSVDEEWHGYTVVYNGKPYTLGWRVDNPNACWMSKLKQKEMTKKDYYDIWTQRKSDHSYGVQGAVGLEDEVYGDHVSGLGSVFTERVREELQEAIEFISSVKDDHEYGDLIDDLREILDINTDR